MATASSMIFSSLIKTGEKSIGGSFTSAEGTYYLDQLNSMLESWSIDRLFVYQVTTESFTLTPSTAAYAIGSSAAFSTSPRPTKIIGAYHRMFDGTDTPVKIIPFDSYAGITDKSAVGDIPEFLFYDQGLTPQGYGRVFIWPAANASTTLFLQSWKQVQSFAAISTTVLLPPGYQRAIEANFALEILSGTGAVVDNALVKAAKDSKALLRGFNAPDSVMSVDPGVVQTVYRSGNILTGP